MSDSITIVDNLDAVHFLMVCLCEDEGTLCHSSLGEVRLCDKHGNAVQLRSLADKYKLLVCCKDETGDVVPLRPEQVE